MPLVDPKPTAPPPLQPQPVKVTDPTYQGVVVDSRYAPQGSLLTYVEGSNWTVQYYSQVLGPDNELSVQQIDRAAAYQQYWLVENLEIKVTTPLSSTQDPNTKSMQATGAATVGPYLIPNVGDMFLADMGDGRLGRYTVTGSEKKTYLKESVYAIEYTLLGYLDDGHKQDLDRKVVKTTHYVKDFLTFGQNPMVLDDAFNDQIAFKREYQNLVGQYLRDFFSNEYQTLLIPGQAHTSYDPFLPLALTSVVEASEHPLIGKIRFPGVGGDVAFSTDTCWSALLQMNESILVAGMQKALLFPTINFKSLPQYTGIYYAGIEHILYPVDKRTDVDAGYDAPCTPLGGEQVVFAGRRYSDLTRLLGGTGLDGFGYSAGQPGALPNIVPVTADPYYVFTAGFYGMEGKTPISQLEVLTLKAIRGEALDNALLHQLAQQALKWENLERFYYTPVLLILLKLALRRN